MNHKKKWSILGLVVMTVFATMTLFWPSKQGKNTEAIVIGSKNFTESKIVMQIWADALKQAGYKVRVKPNISGSVVYQAIKSKQIDLYPEYTGTIVTAYLNKHIVGQSAAQVAQMARAGVSPAGLTTFAYAPGNDVQGIAIRRSVAKKYGIWTLSDLQKKANKVRFISQGEFDQRDDGLVGLEKVYGKFNFKSHKLYDPSLRYEILAKGEGDITPASTTEGQLATKQYFALKDNKHFWPAYNLVPLARKAIVRSDPGIAKVLNRLDRKLTTKELQLLNKQVDVDGRDYRVVARKWVEQNY
jgi:osmoprotectant transport system substrate-binding protein